jgi:hypothetical protein
MAEKSIQLYKNKYIGTTRRITVMTTHIIAHTRSLVRQTVIMEAPGRHIVKVLGTYAA